MYNSRYPSNNQLLFIVIGVFIIGIMTVVSINIFNQASSYTDPEPVAVILSQPEWSITIAYATAIRLDTMEKIKVAFSDSRISKGSRVILDIPGPDELWTTIARLDTTEN